jgi:HTH-type transcriptional regulator/antitoxin HigA
MYDQIDAEAGTPEADEMEVLVMRIEAYKRIRYPIALADAVEAIRI